MKAGTVITSTHNPKVKSLVSLEKPRERRTRQLFIIEGKREIAMALSAGYRIGNLFYCVDIFPEMDLKSLRLDDKFLVPVTQEVFDKIAIRENSGGVIAVAEMKAHRLADIHLTNNPLVVVLESVEKPGNLGAILRTADAAGVDAIISCDPQTDFYNPNVIRSSLGCVFTKCIATATSAETIVWLKSNGLSIYGAYLPAAKPYWEVDFRKPSAVVFGSEAAGLSEPWVKNADANIVIPQKGTVDSLNVSNACAVMVFEAIRQRSGRQ